MRSIKRIWAVALLTSTEGLRQPAFFLLFLVAAALTALSPTFAVFHLGEEAKMVTDLGLSTVLTFSTLMAVLTASTTVTDEIEGRTALTMLSKPLRREEFLLGKYLGIVITANALVLLMSTVILATLRGQMFDRVQDPWFGEAVQLALCTFLLVFAIAMVSRLIFSGRIPVIRGFWIAYGVASAVLFGILAYKAAPKQVGIGYTASFEVGWDWRLLAGLLFIGLHTCVISAVAVALATRMTLVQAFLGTAVFFIVGHASGGLVAPFHGDHGLTLIGQVIRTILPDLDQFNLTDALATSYLDRPIPIPMDVVASSSLYAVLYTLALLGIGNALFARRELG